MTISRAARFASVYAVLTASHEFADHWIQADSDAVTKGSEGRTGRVACARHVATYTATQAVALVVADRAFGLGVRPARAVAALGFSALTHYYADRSAGRWGDPKPWSLAAVAHARGKGRWLRADPRAGYDLDQAWHKAAITLASAIC
ncbi:hypothetical protein [Embleya sp. NPDC005971]|uniref:hypothetical protein n=1 Tax=Embleya sp. NPDC005971 TaxID=3156724 RepID=UPI0033E63707